MNGVTKENAKKDHTGSKKKKSETQATKQNMRVANRHRKQVKAVCEASFVELEQAERELAEIKSVGEGKLVEARKAKNRVSVTNAQITACTEKIAALKVTREKAEEVQKSMRFFHRLIAG